jgi:hypothetical protein
MKTSQRVISEEVPIDSSRAASVNRREHERLRLRPMYTSVIVEPAHQQMPDEASWLGHAYDVSASGIRIELDEPLEVGQCVKVHVDLTGGGFESEEVHADAKVVWVNDAEDDPGPRRMALRFTDFHSPRHRHRLARFLGDGLMLAA